MKALVDIELVGTITDEEGYSLSNIKGVDFVEMDDVNLDPTTLPTSTYDGSTDMQSGVSYVYTSDATTVTFSLADVATDRMGVYSLIIPVGDTVPSFSYPSNLVWVISELALEANTIYELNIMNGVVTYISYSNE